MCYPALLAPFATAGATGTTAAAAGTAAAGTGALTGLSAGAATGAAAAGAGTAAAGATTGAVAAGAGTGVAATTAATSTLTSTAIKAGITAGAGLLAGKLLTPKLPGLKGDAPPENTDPSGQVASLEARRRAKLSGGRQSTLLTRSASPVVPTLKSLLGS